MSTETTPDPVLTPAQKRAATNAAKKAKLIQVGQTPAPKATKAVLAPVFSEDETPEHTVTECDPKKKDIPGQTHWINFKLPNGATQRFGHKGKPKSADILAIHRSMIVRMNRDAELRRQAEERHQEAVRRLSANG